MIEEDKNSLKTIDQINTQRLLFLNTNDLRDLFEKWSETYCSDNKYFKINNRPVISILNITDFTYYYGFEKFVLLIMFARKIFQSSIGLDPFVIGLFSEVNARNIILANKLPIDGATGYALLPEWRGVPIQEYGELIQKRTEEWYFVQEMLKVPFFPVASAGWDASVRGEHIISLGKRSVFPWSPIVRGVTSELFGVHLRDAVKFNQDMHPQHNIVFLHAWNEWTESSVIEPSDRFGFEFLEKIQQVKSTFNSEEKPTFIAYVYPGWHQSNYRPSVDEWSLLERFRPYFEGHYPPPKPKYGSYDDSKIETSAFQITTAANFEVDAFTYFLYYRPREFILIDPIEATFAALKHIDSNFRVSLTWCLRLPHHSFPIAYPEQSELRGSRRVFGNRYSQAKEHDVTQRSAIKQLDELAVHEFLRCARNL